MKETSLWTRLCDEVRMRAHTPTNLFLALVHLWLPTARPNFHSHVLGMVLDLHLPEHRDMGADPFRKLRDSQVPVLDPVTLLVERHAGNSDNSREGLCHCREGLTQRSRGESKVVGVGTGGSLQEARSVRFQRQNNRHEPPVDRVESHGEQVATHPAALAYTFHHRELPASGGSMLNGGHGVAVHTTEETPQNQRDAGPL